VDDIFTWIKFLHILSATVLFGTGLGTAFQMWIAHRTDDARVIAKVAHGVVIADYFFTTPAVIVQPVTGVLLLTMSGIDPQSSWLEIAYVLYVFAGLCWIPVVWLQVKIRNYARSAAAQNAKLPPEYYRAMRTWFSLGWPAFMAVLVILWLMVMSPDFW
jgi:uncharacterized membrane protein